MVKTITTIILTVIGVLFGMQNFDHVPVYVFWGKAINIRLVFVIAIAGIAGYLVRHFMAIAREDALRRKFHMVRMNNGNKRGRKKSALDHDEEDF